MKKVSPRKQATANFYSNMQASQFGPIEEEDVDDELRSPDRRAITVSSPTKSPHLASGSGEIGINVTSNGYSTEKKDPKMQNLLRSTLSNMGRVQELFDAVEDASPRENVNQSISEKDDDEIKELMEKKARMQ